MKLQAPLLAIESSCDDCAAAIVTPDGVLLSDVVDSQTDTHERFGGVVPEIASRQHLASVSRVVDAALSKAGLLPRELGAIAVTYGPGLVGSLIVGVQFARGMANALQKPLIGVHHIEGHLYAARSEPHFPKERFIGLIASGGHSALYLCSDQGAPLLLGETRDDAAGEAYDKAAKMLGLSYPGGQKIDALAQQGTPGRFVFPIALKSWQSLEYSFSGLKTAFKLKLEGLVVRDDQAVADLCHGLQDAIVTALLDKAFLALRQKQVRHLVIGGGVAANSALRAEALKRGAEEGVEVYLTPKAHCTDNAAMIAQAALRRLTMGQVHSGDFTVRSSSENGEWK